MPITVRCQCGGEFVAGDHLAGSQAPCPACARMIFVPRPGAASLGEPSDAVGAPSAPFEIHCVGCGGHYAAPPHLHGKSMPCPNCGLVLEVKPPADLSPLAPDLPPPEEFDDPYAPARRRERRHARKRRQRRTESRQDRLIQQLGGWTGLAVAASCHITILGMSVWHIVQTAKVDAAELSTTLALVWVTLIGITLGSLGGAFALLLRSEEGRRFSLIGAGAVLVISLGLGLVIIPIQASKENVPLPETYFEQYATLLGLAFFAGMALFAPGVSRFFDD